MITDKLREVMANELVFSIQAQSFHWNVRGMFFGELHSFFGQVYEGSYSTVDRLAEYVRIQGEMAPSCLSVIYRNATITEINYVPGTPTEMLAVLAEQNMQMIQSLTELYDIVKEAGHLAGIADYVSGLLDQHTKWDWMIKSYLVQ